MSKEMKCAYCGCDSVYAKGLCRNCWGRYRRNGTPEYKYKDREPGTPTERVQKQIHERAERRLRRIYNYHPSSNQGKQFLDMYAGGMTMQQIADRYGVTRQYVSLRINS